MGIIIRVTRADASKGTFEGEIDGDLTNVYYDVAGIKNDGYVIEFEGEFVTSFDGEDIIEFDVCNVVSSQTNKDLSKLIDKRAIEKQLLNNSELLREIETERLSSKIRDHYYYEEE